MNLVSLIMKFLTPDLIMKIASALGLDKALIEKGIGAIVPSILSGLAGTAARPEGARTLADALGKIDPGMLGNLAGMVGGSNQAQLVSQGSSMLSGVLGGTAANALGGAIGKFTGMNETATKSLLGMIAPAVMGTLGQQARASNLDASGIASLLASQKDNISAAMPAGLGQLLGGTGLLDGIGGNVRSMTGAATAGSRDSGETTRVAAERASGGTNPLVWLALLAAIAAGAWWYVKGRQTTTSSPAAISAEVKDAGASLKGLGDELSGVLKQVKDEASAKSQLPKLENVLKTATTLEGVASKATGEGRKTLAGIAATILKTLDPVIAQALGATGAGTILKPILDNIRGRLEAIAKG